jgi:uncharacterized protein (TIGR00375 family)
VRVITDLHVHSKYAGGTSERCDLDGFAEGAKLKGISLVGTGDFTHPRWFDTLKAKLGENRSGIFNYDNVNFILSTEVNVVFELNGKIKKMHHVILAPSLEIVEQINDRLKKYGDLAADGRPTLMMSSAALVEELMQISTDIFIFPSHAWTPWFSVFGSNSGVNSMEEAFEDQVRHIYAFESGLSSDPAMNWMISALDKYTIVSNSDCHSIDNLGREANVFELKELTYDALINAIKTKKGFIKTYEFYPEEGKYHYDGHRSCKILFSPEETKKHKGVCPVCKKKLTIGVMNRVTELADRKYGFMPENAVPFQHIVPLKTVIAKALKKTAHSLAVEDEYSRLIRYFGNEFAVYEAKEEQIRLATSTEIADALIKVNKGKVRWIPGYDGVFGELILDENEKSWNAKDTKQKTLGDF